MPVCPVRLLLNFSSELTKPLLLKQTNKHTHGTLSVRRAHLLISRHFFLPFISIKFYPEMLSTNIGDTFTIHMDILLEISDERNNSITQTQTDWQETNARTH